MRRLRALSGGFLSRRRRSPPREGRPGASVDPSRRSLASQASYPTRVGPQGCGREERRAPQRYAGCFGTVPGQRRAERVSGASGGGAAQPSVRGEEPATAASGPTRSHVVFVFVDSSILCCNDMQALRLSSSVEASRNPFFVSRLEKLAGKQLWLSRHWAPQALDRIAKSGSQRSGTPGVSVADTTTRGERHGRLFRRRWRHHAGAIPRGEARGGQGSAVRPRYDPAPLPHTSPSATAGELELEG